MDTERIDQIIERHGREESALIQVLLEIQKELHWIPGEALERVSERLGVPEARIRHHGLAHLRLPCIKYGWRADDGIADLCADAGVGRIRPGACRPMDGVRA